LIGAPWADGAEGTFLGSGYIFERDAQTGIWAEVSVLQADDRQQSDALGVAVALVGDTALIGASGDDDMGAGAGAVYEFTASGGSWVQLDKFYSSIPGDDDFFGNSLAVNSETIVIGASGVGNGTTGGNYVVVDTTLIGTPYCSVNVNSTGLAAVIRALGRCSVVDNSLSLVAAQLPPNKFGYFLLSETQAFFPNPGGSDGNLCIGGVIGRFQALVQNSGTEGEIQISVDLTSVPLFGSILAGETWNFTCWYRDVGGASNFTGGITIPFN